MIEHHIFDYPVDGSDSVVPAANAWVKHNDSQRAINVAGYTGARAVLGPKAEQLAQPPQNADTSAQAVAEQPPTPLPDLK